MSRPFALAAALAVALTAGACDLSTPQVAPAHPPASSEDPMAEAEAMEAAGQRVTAYQAYARLAQELPADDPRKAEARERARRLGFLLGIPDGDAVTTHNLAPPSVDPGRSQAVAEARALYEKAQEKRAAGDSQGALEDFSRVLTLVDSKEDPELYWNAFQSVGDLSPEPPPRPESDGGYGGEDGGDDGEGDDGDGGDSGEGPGGREAYMRGMSLERAGRLPQARDAFKAALRDLRIEEDPQLVRAAQQHLSAVEEKLGAAGVGAEGM